MADARLKFVDVSMGKEYIARNFAEQGG